MTNLQNSGENSFADQVQSFAVGLVTAVTALSPLILVVIVLGIAASNALVEYLYQKDVFGPYAWLPATLIAGFRFSSGLGGISLIKSRRFIVGIFFIATSLLLTVYSWWHVPVIAQSIAPQHMEQAEFTISMVLWCGFLGEAMLAGFVYGVSSLGKSTRWFEKEPAANGKVKV